MNEFKIGDRVKAVSAISNNDNLIGKYGCVCHITNGSIGINFDEEFTDGHSCDSHCTEGHGRYTSSNSEIELVTGKKGGKTPKAVPVDKHVVIEDSCNNFHSISNSYNEAVEKAKKVSGDTTIYKMTEVAKVSSVKQVKKKRK